DRLQLVASPPPSGRRRHGRETGHQPLLARAAGRLFFIAGCSLDLCSRCSSIIIVKDDDVIISCNCTPLPTIPTTVFHPSAPSPFLRLQRRLRRRTTDLSSPASSGYGRSTTSESEELQQSAVRFSSRPAAAAAQSSSGGGRRAAGGADGGGGGEWDVMNMPRHPFLTAIGRFLPVDDIEDLGSLGEGFFSVVDKVRIRSTGEILVRKVAKPGVRGERRETHADVAREAKMLRRLEHDNVLALRGMSIVQSDIG
ncbi:hypothetical protein PFISCL1PPCAC_28997, partial [Pristionchus fissidentatus]